MKKRDGNPSKGGGQKVISPYQMGKSSEEEKREVVLLEKIEKRELT